ncbi:hypothetical protein FSP39_008679 [Pinctada imbricata]|uniref:C2H2-type domain-containing protein n=1 Tax=Pinctada imbricata TaxID=66713 RepID=A0AA89BSI3_PINIB|nr:hypothetical protein FSP39_008679 [Pinctada imbricata]
MQSIHSVKPAEVYTCNYCNAPYKNLYSLHEHMRAVHQNQPCLDIKYPCSLCGRQFGSIETLIQHKRALHPDEHKRSRSEYIKNLPRRDSRSKESPRQKQTTDDTNTKTIDNKSPIGFAKQPDASEKVSNSLPKPLQQESIVCEYCNATFYDFNNFQRHMKHHLENTFWCKLCNQKFTSEEQLETHAASHYLRKTTQCALCKEIFDSKVNIQVHFAVKHSNECQIYQCSACESVFRSEMEWQIHLRVNHLQVNKPYRCLFCKDSFSTEMDLQCHLTTHNKPLKCPMCDEAFNVEYLLDKHVNEVHSHSTVDTPRSVEVDSNQGLSVKVKEEKKDPTSRIEVQTSGISGISGFPTNSPGKWTSPTPPNITGVNMWGSVDRDSPWKSPPSNSPGAWKISPVNSPSLWKTSELLHTCNICDVKFFHQSALQMHKAVDHRLTDRHHSSSHSPGEFKCSDCNKSFSMMVNLINHRKLHEKREQNYKCSLCPKILNSMTELQKHFFMDHSNTELDSAKTVYRCSECDEEFPCQSNLQGHMRIHSAGTKYPCPHCPKVFALSRNLTIHMRSHSGEKPYQCPICHKRFARKENRKAHLRSHGGVKPFLCPMCGKSFTRKCHVKEHMKCHFTQVGSVR